MVNGSHKNTKTMSPKHKVAMTQLAINVYKCKDDIAYLILVLIMIQFILPSLCRKRNIFVYHGYHVYW